MIKKGDLRLGNLITESNPQVEGPVIVNWEHIKSIEENETLFNFLYYEKLINEKVLKDLGFTKVNLHKDNYPNFIKRHGKICVNIHYNRILDRDYHYVLYSEKHGEIVVGSVHILQNVLWDIAREELDINM